MQKKYLFIPLLLAGNFTAGYAQLSPLVNLNKNYQSGLELLNHEKYVAAALQFKLVEQSRLKPDAQQESNAELTLLKENAKFYAAVCALELGNADAESLFQNTVYSSSELQWMSKIDFGTHLLKYDISGMSINPDKLAKVLINQKVSDSGNMANVKDASVELYAIGAGWPLTTNNCYAELANANVFVNSELIAEKDEPLISKGYVISMDISKYMKDKIKMGNVGEYNFRLASKKANPTLIMARLSGSSEYAPMEFYHISSDASIVTYTPSNSNVNVQNNSQITMTFEKPVVASTITSDNVVVKKNGEPISGYSVKLNAAGNTAVITFNNVLEYYTNYSVELTKNIKFVGDDNKFVFNTLSFTTEKVPFEFFGMTLTNDGKELSDLSKRTSQNIIATSKVTNNSEQKPRRVVIIVGLYSKIGEKETMIDSKSVVKTLSVGESADISANFTIPNIQGATYSVGCYVWDGFAYMKRMFSNKLQ